MIAQVGGMHTNYTELSRRTLPRPAGALVGFVSHVMNSQLCSIPTHKASQGTCMRHLAKHPAFR